MKDKVRIQFLKTSKCMMKDEVVENKTRKIVAEECQLCSTILHHSPEPKHLAPHLCIAYSEATRSKFKLQYTRPPKLDGDCAMDDQDSGVGGVAVAVAGPGARGKPIANIWSQFITIKRLGRNFDSFSKKCGKKISTPKAQRLVHHLEICGGFEDGENDQLETNNADDTFWKKATEALLEEEKQKKGKERRKRKYQAKVRNSKLNYEEKVKKSLEGNTTKKPSSYKRKAKPVICEVCGTVVTNGKFGLKIHMATHSKARPFKCDQCPYSAKLKVALKKHILVLYQGVKITRKNPPIRRGGKKI